MFLNISTVLNKLHQVSAQLVAILVSLHGPFVAVHLPETVTRRLDHVFIHRHLGRFSMSKTVLNLVQSASMNYPMTGTLAAIIILHSATCHSLALTGRPLCKIQNDIFHCGNFLARGKGSKRLSEKVSETSVNFRQQDLATQNLPSPE